MITGAAMLLRDTDYPPVGVCAVKDQGKVDHASTLSAYERAARDHEAKWSPKDRARACTLLEGARNRLDDQAAAMQREVVEAKRRALRDEAHRILFQSAHILDIQEGFFTGVDEAAVDRLCRKRPVPYRGLRSILAGDVPPVSASDSYRTELEKKRPPTIQQLMNRLKERGLSVLSRYATLSRRR